MSRKCQERVTDVVTWHDIDLDYVLGDYTESENEFSIAASAVNFPASGSSSGGEDPGKENKPTSSKERCTLARAGCVRARTAGSACGKPFTLVRVLALNPENISLACSYVF